MIKGTFNLLDILHCTVNHYKLVVDLSLSVGLILSANLGIGGAPEDIIIVRSTLMAIQQATTNNNSLKDLNVKAQSDDTNDTQLRCIFSMCFCCTSAPQEDLQGLLRSATV